MHGYLATFVYYFYITKRHIFHKYCKNNYYTSNILELEPQDAQYTQPQTVWVVKRASRPARVPLSNRGPWACDFSGGVIARSGNVKDFGLSTPKSNLLPFQSVRFQCWGLLKFQSFIVSSSMFMKNITRIGYIHHCLGGLLVWHSSYCVLYMHNGDLLLIFTRNYLKFCIYKRNWFLKLIKIRIIQKKTPRALFNISN